MFGATLNDSGWYKSALDWYKANIPFLDVPDKYIQDCLLLSLERGQTQSPKHRRGR
jgi:hypothetical protein